MRGDGNYITADGRLIPVPQIPHDNTELIDWIIKNEGFNEHPKDIGDGKITLGSGLTDPKWIELYKKRGNVWSQQDNRMAVIEEVNNREQWMQKNFPNWNKLDRRAQEALLSYRYNYNFTPANSPKLFKAASEFNIPEIANQMDATSKDPKFRDGLYNRREEERNWFFSGAYDYMRPRKGFIGSVRNFYDKARAKAYTGGIEKGGIRAEGGSLNQPKYWNNLSMAEKAEMIRTAIRNGITNLSDIKAKYNEFATGGPTDPPTKFNTTSGAGYVPPAPTNIPSPVDAVRSRLYRTVNPYTDYNIPKNLAEFLSGDTVEYDVNYDEKGLPWTDFEDGTSNPAVVDDIWAKYLGIPESQRRFKSRIAKSPYRPQVGDNSEVAYYGLPLTNEEKESLIAESNDLPLGANKTSDVLSQYNLALHTVGRGHDDKGEYASYYDRWDINPFSGKYQGLNIPLLGSLPDASFGIGKPVEIYDRIYLDDYYGVPSKERGHNYLPEITVTPKGNYIDNGKEGRQWFAQGGNLFKEGGEPDIYELAKKHIRENEGFVSKPMRDGTYTKIVNGKKVEIPLYSVGYGFNNSGFWDKYPGNISEHYKNGITRAQAEKELDWILRTKVVPHLQKEYKDRWNGLNAYQKAAIIDSYYQRPVSVLKGSQFYNAFMRNDPNAVNYLGVKGYESRNKKRRALFGSVGDIEIPEFQPVDLSDYPAFVPSNPEAFNMPLESYQQPIVAATPPEPLVEAAKAYSAEELKKQEQMQGLRNFGMVMGMLNPDSNSPYINAINMLTGNVHGLGGNLFDDGGDKDNNPNIFKYTNKLGDVRYVYRATPESEEIAVRPLDTTSANPVYWTFVDDSGRQYTPRVSPTAIAELNPDNRGFLERAWDNYIGEAINTVPKGYHTLPAIAASALLPLAGEAFAGTSIAGIPATSWADAALTAGFGTHGLQDLANGNTDWMTALEIAPLGSIVRPMYNAGRSGYSAARAFFNDAKANQGFAVSSPRIGRIFGKDAGQFTAWIPTDRPWSEGLSWINTGAPTTEGLPVQYITSKHSGEARKLYDAVIRKARKGGHPGIVTGSSLVSAPKTYSTLEHYYPSRVKLDDMGHWSNDNMTGLFEGPRKTVYTLDDFLKTVSENPTERVHFLGAPRYRLETPSTAEITAKNTANMSKPDIRYDLPSNDIIVESRVSANPNIPFDEAWLAASKGRHQMSNLVGSDEYAARVRQAYQDNGIPVNQADFEVLQAKQGIKDSNLKVVPNLKNANGEALNGQYDPNTRQVLVSQDRDNILDVVESSGHEHAHASEVDKLLGLLKEKWKHIKPRKEAFTRSDGSVDTEWKDYISKIVEMRAPAMSVWSEMKELGFSKIGDYLHHLKRFGLEDKQWEALVNRYGQTNAKYMVESVFGLSPLIIMSNNDEESNSDTVY